MCIDWDKWMKDHHVKICTEEELKKKQQMKTLKSAMKKATRWAKNHRKEFLDNLALRHASET